MASISEAFPKIGIIVKTRNKIRLFITERFSIRTFVIHLNRYNPHYQIIDIGYPADNLDIPNNRWLDYSPKLANCLKPFKFQGEYKYRELLNMEYAKIANNGKFPSRHALNGKPLENYQHPIVDVIGKEIQHITFVSDELMREHGMIPSDILLWYEGKQIQRTLNGITRKGYILDRYRGIIGENLDTNEER